MIVCNWKSEDKIFKNVIFYAFVLSLHKTEILFLKRHGLCMNYILSCLVIIFRYNNFDYYRNCGIIPPFAC